MPDLRDRIASRNRPAAYSPITCEPVTCEPVSCEPVSCKQDPDAPVP
jgi:hypothetical protein